MNHWIFGMHSQISKWIEWKMMMQLKQKQQMQQNYHSYWNDQYMRKKIEGGGEWKIKSIRMKWKYDKNKAKLEWNKIEISMMHRNDDWLNLLVYSILCLSIYIHPLTLFYLLFSILSIFYSILFFSSLSYFFFFLSFYRC